MDIIDSNVFQRTVLEPDFPESGVVGAIFGLNTDNSTVNISKASFKTIAGIINAENNSQSVLTDNVGTVFTQGSRNSYINNDIRIITDQIENNSYNNAFYNFDEFNGDLERKNYNNESSFTRYRI